jgi:uroporphyrin-III C-methyltransferase
VRLLAAGRAAATPALIVENASRADERRIVTTLAGLAEAAAGLSGPALLIVGEAMALAASSALPGEGRDPYGIEADPHLGLDPGFRRDIRRFK